MFFDAKNGEISLDSTKMSYAVFGKGSKVLLILPGLSDGLATVRGKAKLLAAPYRMFFENYTVYMFSRKDDMPEGYSIRDMAEDQVRALRLLGIERFSVLGVSEGGMIAQYIAIDHPEAVEKLVLAVTGANANEKVMASVPYWMELAEKGDHKKIMIDTAEKSYSPYYLMKYRQIYPFIGLIGRPKSYDRFLANAKAILGFDSADELCRISCPCLIIAGEDDKIVGLDASYELNEKIKGSLLHVYKGLGHGAYEEAKDFNKRVFDFLES